MLGLCLTPVRNSELGKVEPTHICADHLVDRGVVCCAEVYSVMGRFKAIPAPPVVWKIHAFMSTQYSALQIITESISMYLVTGNFSVYQIARNGLVLILLDENGI